MPPWRLPVYPALTRTTDGENVSLRESQLKGREA